MVVDPPSVIDDSLYEYFPQPSEFVAVERQPILIEEVEPEYPGFALLTDTEGLVWVQALIDRSGRVRDARIAKSSGSYVGFDEAALEAAYKYVYEPAIQNGQPISVWITFPIKFELKR